MPDAPPCLMPLWRAALHCVGGQLEKNLRSVPSVTQMMSSGMSPEDITARILDGIGVGPGAMTIQPK